MQKRQLANIFRSTSNLLGIGMFPPDHTVPALELIQLLTFMAEQIEKELSDADHPTGEIHDTRTEA